VLLQGFSGLINTLSAQASPVAGGGAMSMVVMLVIMFAIVYFLMIRPQQKQQKTHRDFLGRLKRGDEVVTQSGFIGKVHEVKDTVVILELADKVRVKVIKQAISANAPGVTENKEESEKSK